MKKGYGLGRLRPEWRFALVFTISMLFIFIDELMVAAGLFLFGLVLLLLNQEKNWKLALSAPVSGGMMFFYNAILSPAEAGGVSWWIFTVNQVGIERGLVTGLRLIGMMFISFAWLFSTPIPEMYQGIAWFKPAEMWALGILRGIQIIKHEFIALTQSLIIRGLRWDSLRANLKNLVPLVTAIIPIIVKNAQEATLASQSHQHQTPKGDGSLETNQLFVRYSERLGDILQDINLSVKPGEFVYLAGKCRAGKTTLLRSLGGVISWVMGEFRGKVIVSGMQTDETALAELSGSTRFIAPNPFASIHGLTVGQEISFLAKDREDAQKALETMGIGDLWERETTKLSGGQQVRLVLAGALASEAKILLLDSPMQELDPEGRKAFMEALAILRKQERCTIVVADPFWEELKHHTDRVIVLENGQQKADLTAQEFFGNHRWLRDTNLLTMTTEARRFAPGEVAAEMKDVSVALEGNRILTDFNLCLRKGELLVVMGPNGSGKTTAMLTLAGAIAPQKGEVKTNGQVGFVFQNPGLQTVNMTVVEELAFGPKILGWSADEVADFVEAGLEWTGLEPNACPLDLHPADIRLLAIAASNTDVSILVLDEPTIGFDTEGIEKVIKLVKTLVEDKGKTVVIITHDETIARLADRVVIIDKGKITYDGPNNQCPRLRPEG